MNIPQSESDSESTQTESHSESTQNGGLDRIADELGRFNDRFQKKTFLTGEPIGYALIGLVLLVLSFLIGAEYAIASAGFAIAHSVAARRPR